MKTLHLCNTNYEWELEQDSRLKIKESLLAHPNFLQLQFLPFLYAKPGDGVMVTHFSENIPKYLNVHLYEEPVEGYDQIETWGWSQAVEQWSPLPYAVPKRLKECAAKPFAFTHSPHLPGAKLLHHERELLEWLDHDPYPKVLKGCFGFAGRRRKILHKRSDYTEHTLGYPLIGEPWVEREMDFSTQWLIDETIHYLGATVMENTEWGHYSRTYIDREIPLLEAQKKAAQIPLKRLKEKGFRGNVGIDAFVYDNTLHPVVEMNTRKTMGWLALTLGKNIAYENGTEGLLPKFLKTPKKISFQKQLKLL